MTTSTLSLWSNHLFTATLLIYALAMLAFAVDLATSRRRAVPVTAQTRMTAQCEHAREAQLVIAGSAFQRPAPPPDLHTGPELSTMSPPDHAWRWPARIAITLTAVGWLAHLAEVVTRGVAAGRVPWGNMYEFSSAVCLVAVTAFLLLAVRVDVARFGVYVLVPVLAYLGVAGTLLYTRAAPLQPVLNSYWLKIHVVAAITATGTFMLTGVVTVLLLLRHRLDRRQQLGGAVTTLSRLPSAATLDLLERRLITFAFPVWTFAVVAGAIWAEAAWGRYWGWDPKETWSFITWVIYACYLHARATPRWRRSAQVFALLGFAALIFNYYFINLVVNGLHSYAGV